MLSPHTMLSPHASHPARRAIIPHAPRLRVGKPRLPSGPGEEHASSGRHRTEPPPPQPLPKPRNPQFWETRARSPAQRRPCDRTKRQQRSHHVPAAAAAGLKRCGGSAAAWKMVRTWRGRGRRRPAPYAGPGMPAGATGCGNIGRGAARPRGGFSPPSPGAAAMRRAVRRPLPARLSPPSGRGGRRWTPPAHEGAGGGGGGDGGGRTAPHRRRVLPRPGGRRPAGLGWARLSAAASRSLSRRNGERAAGGGPGRLPVCRPRSRRDAKERFFLPFSRRSLITRVTNRRCEAFPGGTFYYRR